MMLVIKRNPQGAEVWRWEGKVLQREDAGVLLEATFNHPDLRQGDILFTRGDRFVEAYCSAQWYNIFEIHEGKSDMLKCWYCNIAYPAQITKQVNFRDLALDLLVYPDGRMVVLDENEFSALEISNSDKEQARGALAELQQLFTHHRPVLERDFSTLWLDPAERMDALYEERLRAVITEQRLKIEQRVFQQSCHSVEKAAKAVGAAREDFVKNICLLAEDGRLIVAIIKGEDRVNLKKVARAIGEDGRLRSASPEEILHRTGYPCGGTPPFGFYAVFMMDERTFEKDLLYTGGGSERALITGTAQEFQRANGAIIASLHK
jgi:Cys-tRNA(Pro)/Cys-tRNA(Cys) deacylase